MSTEVKTASKKDAGGVPTRIVTTWSCALTRYHVSTRCLQFARRWRHNDDRWRCLSRRAEPSLAADATLTSGDPENFSCASQPHQILPIWTVKKFLARFEPFEVHFWQSSSAFQLFEIFRTHPYGQILQIRFQKFVVFILAIRSAFSISLTSPDSTLKPNFQTEIIFCRDKCWWRTQRRLWDPW